MFASTTQKPTVKVGLRGRSGETRTRGLMVPNHARYQLRYTSMTKTDTRFRWSGKRESNPQPSAWEATALPLSHFRTQALTRSIIASSGYFRYLPIISLLSLFVKSFYADLQKSFPALIHTMRDNARASRPVYYFERDGHFGFSAEQIKLYIRAVVMPVDFRYRAFPAL